MDAPDPHDEVLPAIRAHQTRRGVFLLVVYVLLFAEFLFVTIHSPALMARTEVPFTENFTLRFGGANVAVVAGVIQATAAVLLAFVFVRPMRPGKS